MTYLGRYTTTFDTWAEVREHVAHGKNIYYQAPLDRYASTVRCKNFKNGKIRVYPGSREVSVFTADSGHLERFRKPVTVHELHKAGKLHRHGLTISPSFHLAPCAEMLDKQSRGLIGFHRFEACPNCVKTFKGWEFWASFGHRQTTAPDRESLLRSIKRFAADIWRAENEQGPGHYYGWRIRVGSAIHWR